MYFSKFAECLSGQSVYYVFMDWENRWVKLAASLTQYSKLMLFSVPLEIFDLTLL